MRTVAATMSAAVLSAGLVLGATGPVSADQPPGQRGYEGQPGNQGGHQGGGPTGYEGQPGNQGGH